jgi:hypothetical protein
MSDICSGSFYDTVRREWFNIYLVTGDVSKSEYEGKTKNLGKISRIVFASSRDEAIEKFEKYWSDKDSEYAYWYRVSGCEAHEAIH